MKRTLLIVAVLLAVLFAVGATVLAQRETPSFNGTFWHSLGNSDRGAYVRGYMDGRVDGSIDACVNLKAIGTTIDCLNDTQPGLFRKGAVTPSVAEIVASINALYRQPDNMPICMGHTAFVGWRSLTGHPLPSSKLESLRSTDGASGCR